MTSEMDEAVDMNTDIAGDDMPEANETDVMEGEEESAVGVETGLMPGELLDVAVETEMISDDEMNGASDPMGGREVSMSEAAGKHPIELAGSWKLTLSIASS